jgi:imidazolonepropionase
VSTAFTNIGSLVTNDHELGSGLLGEIADAALVVEGGLISWVGSASELQATDDVVDLSGRAVVPGFVDSHAHLAFAGDRSAEFAARMAGTSYSAGGIKTTVAATRAASDDELRTQIASRVAEFHRSGITTFESKSGYGLTVKDEARTVRLNAEVTPESTFLGAHVVPAEYANNPDGYVELVCNEMLAATAENAKWIDVFCDRGAFDYDQSEQVLRAGIAGGLLPRIHANQLEAGRGVELAVKLDCASADHCTHLSENDIDLLAGSSTVATLLPGAEFSTRAEYPDARRLWGAGATVAIATDCNPGSSFTTSMAFCVAVAVRDMHFTPEQAIWSATMGGARALRRNDIGGLSIGMRADFAVLDAPNATHLAYRPGVDLIESTWISGIPVHRRNK